MQKILEIGSRETNLTIGGNVTNDFLDHLAANQYQKQADRDTIKDLQWQLKTAKKQINELRSEIVVLKAMKL